MISNYKGNEHCEKCDDQGDYYIEGIVSIEPLLVNCDECERGFAKSLT